ncbi:MAG TPA: GntR family transcriptional regulator [Anaerolineae bacterium]|nr:GntR family transcriptional regulator [Anaerolineae bacterium]
MVIEIEFRSHVPIYLQIVEQVEHMVATGVFQPHDQLPTVRQLAAELRVNFNTVARAYRLLDETGVISTQRGRGTFVLEPMPPERARQLREVTLDGLARSFLADAAYKGFSPEEIAEATQPLLDRWQAEGAPPIADE